MVCLGCTGEVALDDVIGQRAQSFFVAAPGEELVFPADLVVLINPASSAIHTKQLVDILARAAIEAGADEDAADRLFIRLRQVLDVALRFIQSMQEPLAGIAPHFTAMPKRVGSNISSGRN